MYFISSKIPSSSSYPCYRGKKKYDSRSPTLVPNARNAILSLSLSEFQQDNDQKIVLIVKNCGFQCVDPKSTVEASARQPKSTPHTPPPPTQADK